MQCLSLAQHKKRSAPNILGALLLLSSLLGLSLSILAYRTLKKFGVLLAEGLNKTSGSSEEMKDFLYAVRDYPGVSGPITYDANGDLTRQHTIYVIKDGRLNMLPQ